VRTQWPVLRWSSRMVIWPICAHCVTKEGWSRRRGGLQA
jgi:hypothetical protein